MSTATAIAHATRTGLTAAESAHWREHGWVAVPDFFAAAEVAILRAELAALQTAGKLRNVATVGDGKTHSTTAFNLQICPVGPHSRPIRALAYAAKVRAAIISLLGDSACQHLDQIFLKPGRHGAGTNWHTDNAYFQSTVVEAGTGMWIALHDANRANGTMQIVPGSHRQDLAHRRDGGSDHHITCADVIDPAKAVHIELPAGGVLFFNYGVAHATGPNTTDHERAGLALHFLQEQHFKLSDGWTTPATVWQRRIGSQSDGGKHIHGEDLRGVWESLVA
jgi:ectoine hydroxylase-related dioxygenase (phytanoyl-CoA dioxygenase family)